MSRCLECGGVGFINGEPIVFDCVSYSTVKRCPSCGGASTPEGVEKTTPGLSVTDPALIVLTPVDLELARTEGIRRQTEDDAKGRKTHFEMNPDDPNQKHILGAEGELAFHRWYYPAREWIPQKRVGDCDVGPFDVRCIRHRGAPINATMYVRKNDKDGRPMAFVIKASETEFWIVGWIEVSIARRVGSMEDPGARGLPRWVVKAKDVHPLRKKPGPAPEVKTETVPPNVAHLSPERRAQLQKEAEDEGIPF